MNMHIQWQKTAIVGDRILRDVLLTWKNHAFSIL